MTLDEFAAEVCERLRADMQSIRNPDGDIHPALFSWFEDDGSGLIRRFKIPKPWFSSGATKDVMMRSIEAATVMAKPSIIGYEATTWHVDGPLDGSELTIRPSEHPDRKESVSLMILDREHTQFWTASVTRDGRNPPVYGEWQHLDDAYAFSGRVPEGLQRAMLR